MFEFKSYDMVMLVPVYSYLKVPWDPDVAGHFECLSIQYYNFTRGLGLLTVRRANCLTQLAFNKERKSTPTIHCPL